MAKSSVVRQYAEIGASARAQELRAELAEIEKAFPGLTRRGPGRPATTVSSRDVEAPAAKKRARKPMTAAQKKAVGIRMTAYWAARRKAKAAK
jgi:hypothetical protein